ncbi:hypothetical protein JCM13210_03280 [Thermaerobacter litoralis]
MQGYALQQEQKARLIEDFKGEMKAPHLLDGGRHVVLCVRHSNPSSEA